MCYDRVRRSEWLLDPAFSFMNEGLLAALTLGFLRGLQHALDADHLVAVSTIVSEHKSIRRSSLIGTFWGAGHTASLLVVGVVVLLLRTAIPKHIEPWMEAPVAVMLIVLGISATWKALRDRGVQIHKHTHTHADGQAHTHLHLHAQDEHQHRHQLLRIGRRPFVVGMVHGVAGSALLTFAVLTTIPSFALGVLYIAVFGFGSIGGMLLMSAMIGLPFAVTAHRFAVINGSIRLCAGVFSILFGLFVAWNLIHEALLTKS